MKNKRFHQMVHLEKGPVNTAVIDFLKGNLYQLKNELVEQLFQKKSKEMTKLTTELEREELLIKIDKDTWIPYLELEPAELEDIKIILEIEEGADIEQIEEKCIGYSFASIEYFGNSGFEKKFLFTPVIKREKNFDHCLKEARVTGTFDRINEDLYCFSKKLNPCWGKKVAVTKDNKVRPCIYSTLDVGNFKNQTMAEAMQKLEKYWFITKDKVETCKDCELRYVCFDCREASRRECNNIYGANPLCLYNPYTGEWRDG